MSLPGSRFTYEEYKQLPDDKRYEVIEGELLMTPAPTARHQRILFRLGLHLGNFVLPRSLGDVLQAPTDVILSPENVVQPDLLYVARERIGIIDPQGGIHGAPDLVVEVLSPSTSSRDQLVKRQLYGKYGVREYWIVDPAANSIAVLTRQGTSLETWCVFPGESILTSNVLPGLQVPVAALFSD